MHELFDQFPGNYGDLKSCIATLFVAVDAVCMFIVAVIFDIVQANLLGIGALLWTVFYGSAKLSSGNLLVFILALIPLSAGAFGAMLLSVKYAPALREALLAVLAP
mmetsp:Transcript_100377/g.158256  ORF Transcript_100377/g.158256 Transcript_100377/m.158256 type:complete len:106 (+) Transcript_100377:3-320(+)